MSGGPQTPPLFDLPKVTAIGIASPTAGFLTSGFGVAGTLVGMALTAVIVTAGADVLKVYLARAPGAVTKLPKGLRKSRWRNALGRVWLAFKALSRIRLALSSFRSLPAARRRSILVGSAVASVVSFLIGISIVTGVELSVGKRLSCWVWNECPAEASTADGSVTSTTTTLSAFFGGQGQEAPPAQQQFPSDAKQGLPPSQKGAFPDSSEQPGMLEPSQEGHPSGVPEERRDTQSPAQEQQPGGDDLSRDERNEQDGGKQNPDPQ